MLVWSCLSVEVADTSTVGLTTRQWLDSLWQQALTSIGKVMKQQLARCSTASMIREVKQLIVDFNATLNAHTYSVNRLTDVLLQVRTLSAAIDQTHVSVALLLGRSAPATKRCWS
eukprot:m.160096 g.160096  ORF g.160096 m.160096 type:complete len:115 (+) comp16492_c0_seq44:1067-1411(+)